MTQTISPSVREEQQSTRLRRATRSIANIALGSAILRPLGEGGQNSLTVIAYHDVPDVAAFQAQMLALARGWKPISLDQAFAWTNNETTLPSRACLVTFDDGDRSVVEGAAPILKELSIPAVTFVVTDLIDTDRPFWWLEVRGLLQLGAVPRRGLSVEAPSLVRQLKLVPNTTREKIIEELREQVPSSVTQENLLASDLEALRDSGIAIGNHSASHPCLTRCSDAEVEVELTRSHEKLSSLLGCEPESFAYPNGDADFRVAERLRSMGYRNAFLFDHRIADSGQDPLYTSRVRLDSTESPARVRAVASGVHPRILRILRRG